MVATMFRRMIEITLLVVFLDPAAAQGQAIKVTLLGTGSPPPVMNRFGPSTLVEAGGEGYCSMLEGVHFSAFSRCRFR